MIIAGKKGNYQVCIGLEVHAQLNTDKKLFSGSCVGDAECANSNVSYFDISSPGFMPYLNPECVKKAICLGLAINAKINKKITFDRKNYFYPDLASGYQITQMFNPIVYDGCVEINLGDKVKKIQIDRAHLEQDAGKLIHDASQNCSYVDYNRAGCPLIEIVTAPVIESPDEAIEYLKTLRLILKHSNVCDADMEKGNFRCDANVSVSLVGSKTLGTRCEIKNLNSFESIQKAIVYEANLHVDIIENGGVVNQETKLYNVDTDSTTCIRSKEDAMDYRYFMDPDIPEMEVPESLVNDIKNTLPVSFLEKKEKYINSGLKNNEVNLLIENPKYGEYFDMIFDKYGVKDALTWFFSEFLGKYDEFNVNHKKITPNILCDLIELVKSGKINAGSGKVVLTKMFESFEEPKKLVEILGFEQVSDKESVIKIAQEILSKNHNQVLDYKSGKDKLFGFFIGQLMKETKGQVNAEVANEVMKDLLNK